MGFRNQTINLTASTPSLELYKDRYLHFTRTSNKTWTLEGDAWFLMLLGWFKSEASEYEILRKIKLQNNHIL